MATSELTGGFAYSNIGETKQKIKPQKSCKTTHYYQKELSERSRFQQLLWHLVPFYGRVFLQLKMNRPHVSQEPRVGPRAKDSNNGGYQSSLGSNNLISFANVVRSLSNDLSIVRLKVAGFLYTMWANKRLRWGLLLLLVIAPLSKFIYMLFPVDGFGEYIIKSRFLTIVNFIETPGILYADGGWYWGELYWWAFSCGELWAPLIAIYGIFLLFPKNYYPSYLVGIPFGYFLSLLIHRMFVSSTVEFHNGFGPAMIATWLILGVAIFILSDKLLFNRNHRKRAIEARIVGLIRMPGMDWNDKEKMLRNEAKEWTKQENELFSRAG